MCSPWSNLHLMVSHFLFGFASKLLMIMCEAAQRNHRSWLYRTVAPCFSVPHSINENEEGLRPTVAFLPLCSRPMCISSLPSLAGSSFGSSRGCRHAISGRLILSTLLKQRSAHRRAKVSRPRSAPSFS